MRTPTGKFTSPLTLYQCHLVTRRGFLKEFAGISLNEKFLRFFNRAEAHAFLILYPCESLHLLRTSPRPFVLMTQQ